MPWRQSIFEPFTIKVILNLQTSLEPAWNLAVLCSFLTRRCTPGKARHINLVHPLGASAAGYPPSRLPFYQRCDRSSVTPQPHIAVLKMDGCEPQCPGELQWALSAMVLVVASPPADQAGADSYLAQAQSWIRQLRAANTLLVLDHRPYDNYSAGLRKIKPTYNIY